LRAAGATDVNNPTDPQVLKAIELLNLKQVTTDNLADGMWGVWIAKNQAAVLRNPRLRSLIREATYFEDFTAFSQGHYDRKSEGVELQAALFSGFGRILKNHGIEASDRMPPEKAAPIVEEAMNYMERVIYNYDARSRAAENFWNNVDQAHAIAQKAVLFEV